MLWIVALTIILIVILYYVKNNRKTKIANGTKELPSAPGGLPIFGHMFAMGSRPFLYLTGLSRKIGPIYKIQIGWKEFIVLNDNDTFNKCFKEQGDNFAGRWRNTFTDQLAHYSGVLFQEKEWWAVQRAFSLKVLKDFGFGKSQTEVVIIKEMEKIIEILRKDGERAISSEDIVSIATINVMCDFMMRKEFENTDTDVVNLIKNIRRLAQVAELNNILVNIFPIFKSFPKIEEKLYRFLDKGEVSGTVEDLYDFIRKIVNEHREIFRPENECHDLIDAFLLEQFKLKESNIVEHTFTDWQLVRLITELFVAGFETTSSLLTWAMLILSIFPDIQKKMHDDIIATIGADRFPSMTDRKSLNYVQAVMDEILRFVTTVPLSLPHKVFIDTSVNGFFIPGGTIIFPNIYACHRDPKVWQKPDDFYPDHFLDGDGKYSPRNELIPFGVGKRVCLGESLAKMEYFLFLVTIVQRFKLRLDDESEKRDKRTLLCGSTGIIRGAIPHKIIFTDLHSN